MMLHIQTQYPGTAVADSLDSHSAERIDGVVPIII